MGQVHQPRDLFLQLVGQALYVERRLVGDVLPKLVKQVQDEELRGALAAHLEETRGHVENAERAFRAVQAEPTALRSGAFEGAVADHERTAKEVSQPVLADFFHAAAAAQTEHWEIAVYSAAIELASELGRDDAAKPLEDSRKDEREALKSLEKILSRLGRGTEPG
jgi:ferritin-like metal-binding protein YciE